MRVMAIVGEFCIIVVGEVVVLPLVWADATESVEASRERDRAVVMNGFMFSKVALERSGLRGRFYARKDQHCVW